MINQRKRRNSNTYKFIFPILKVPSSFYYIEGETKKLYKKNKNQEQLNEDDELYSLNPLSIGGASKASNNVMLLALIPLSIPFFSEKVVERELKLLNLFLVFVIVLCMLLFWYLNILYFEYKTVKSFEKNTMKKVPVDEGEKRNMKKNLLRTRLVFLIISILSLVLAVYIGVRFFLFSDIKYLWIFGFVTFFGTFFISEYISIKRNLKILDSCF
ncbi:hypothetical protein GHI93_06150 [Lactococcus hircilactis]|uniref:Uncharacterized protein n=1 Tax=Lactococcus hircilactis TaxID=1494462 RepID=A0A7X2D081_9LACT|nr:hypothetical protein [Lactococcus hircilactis]MQW39519.1 hypothetical protein [Lactococcus hircilactis]